jgi:hypothetical protein
VAPAPSRGGAACGGGGADPGRGGQAAIQEASADAARELRATLSVLRDGDGDCGSGLSQLTDLVARARTAGLAVTVTVTGAERRLPPDVDQAAYRIVQETLTSVSRHADHVGARVHLRYGPDALTVHVDNDAGAADSADIVGDDGISTSAGADLSNDEIAASMVLSPTTAKTHVSRAMIKLGARDRAQVVVFAYQTGLVSARDPGRSAV